VRYVTSGDVVTVEPDEWHWHGGTPSRPMSHITIQMPGFEDVEWDVEERYWSVAYRDREEAL
jgi:quercetin dioxygenase-like cupin family protein